MVELSFPSILFKELNFNCKTFTVKFNVEKYDESETAKAIANLLGSEHHEYEFDLDLTNDLPSIIDHYGEPFGDHSALPTYYLAKHAVKHIKVALTGDGGDESFAGYNTSIALKASSRMNFLLRNKSMHKVFDRYLASGSKKLQWISELNSRKNGHFIYDPMGDKGFRKNINNLIDSGAEEVIAEVDAFNHEFWDNSEQDWVGKGLSIDLLNKLPNNMLTKVDVSSMAHGLEIRSPLLDRSLVEFAHKIPSGIKLPGYSTKPLLRALARQYLPAEIIDRPKKGFSLPVDQWVRNNWDYVHQSISTSKSELEDRLSMGFIENMMENHRQGNGNYGRQIWLILILAIWFKSP